MKLFYKNSLSSLTKLASDIEAYSIQHHVPPAVTYALNLCLDELLTNVISYGQNDNPLHSQIEITLSNSNNQITAVMRDSGRPFNPLENAPTPPDPHSSIEDRPIGGLGVYFIEQYMDKVEYKREKNKNVITLTKYINR